MSRQSTYYGIIYPPEDFEQVVQIGDVVPIIGPGFHTSEDAEAQVCEEWGDIQDQGWEPSRSPNPHSGRGLGAFVVELDEEGVVTDYYSFKPRAKRRKARKGRSRKVQEDGHTYRTANPGGRFAGMVPFFIDMGGEGSSSFQMPDLPEFSVSEEAAAEAEAPSAPHPRAAAAQASADTRCEEASPEIRREVSKTQAGGFVTPLYPERQDLLEATRLTHPAGNTADGRQGKRDMGLWTDKNEVQKLSEIYGINLPKGKTYADLSTARDVGRAVWSAVRAYITKKHSQRAVEEAEEQVDLEESGLPTAPEVVDEVLAKAGEEDAEETSSWTSRYAETAQPDDIEEESAQPKKKKKKARKGVRKAKNKFMEGLEAADATFIGQQLKARLELAAFQTRYRENPRAILWDLGLDTPTDPDEDVYEFPVPPEWIPKYLVRLHHYHREPWEEQGFIEPDVGAFLKAILKNVPNIDQIQGKQFVDLGKQSKKQIRESRLPRMPHDVDLTVLDKAKEEAIEGEISWAVPSGAPDVTVDDGQPYVHGVDNSEEGLREAFGDDAVDTYFLLIEKANKSNFEIDPIHVMLALAGREGMRESLEGDTWFEMSPQSRKAGVDEGAQAVEMLRQMQERVGGLGT